MWWLKRKQDTKQRKEPYNTRQESLQTRWMKLGRTSCRHFKIREESRTSGYPFASCKSSESMLAFLAEHQQMVMRYQNCINWTKLKNEGLSEHEGQNQSNSWKRVKGLALNTVEIVKFDLGLISCSIRVAIVQDPPTITMFSFIENLLVIFAAAANFLSRSK